MAGLPKKYAKMGFKRGWAAYKRSRRGLHGVAGGGGKKGYRKPKVKHAFLFGGSDMTRQAIVRRPVRRLTALTPGKILDPVIDIALIIAGMGLTGFLKRFSPIKNPHIMNAGTGVVAIGGTLITRNRFVKMPLLGAALQSGISETKLLFPAVPLAGDDEVVYLPDDQADQLEYQGDDGRIPEYVATDERIAEEDDRIEGDEGRDT